MKNILSFTAFILLRLSFTFWKIEGPFIAKMTDNQKNILSSIGFHKISYKEELDSLPPELNENYSLLFYNQNSSYLFVSTPTRNVSTLKNFLSFLQDPEKMINSFKESLDFFVIKSSLLATNKYRSTSSLIGGFFINQSFKMEWSSYVLDPRVQKITFSEKISTISGITIKNPIFAKNNQNKDRSLVPILCKNSEKINFQDALKKYFDQDLNYTALATTILQSKFNELQNSSIEHINNLSSNIISVGKQEQELLKKTTILAVLGILKDEKKRNSIVIGLAKDDISEEFFYWVTDLENDISNLWLNVPLSLESKGQIPTIKKQKMY